MNNSALDRIIGNTKEAYICMKCGSSFFSKDTQKRIFVKHGEIVCPHCGSRKIMKNIAYIIN